ncbi:MAG: hypothetical protein K9I74_15085 [Bacteroidales bacterium]|nr:hypothetical protein [Bacteroidales bacterium]
MHITNHPTNHTAIQSYNHTSIQPSGDSIHYPFIFEYALPLLYGNAELVSLHTGDE